MSGDEITAKIAAQTKVVLDATFPNANVTEKPETLSIVALEMLCALKVLLTPEGNSITYSDARAMGLAAIARADGRYRSPASNELLEVLKEAQYFILAPAEDLKDGVLSRIREAIERAAP